MFEDFNGTASSAEGRRRKLQSMAAAVVLYGGVCAGMMAATARAIRSEPPQEEPTVTWAPPPKPVPEPASVAAAPEATRSPHAQERPRHRKRVVPDEVPDQALPESAEPLAAVEGNASVTGLGDDAPGGETMRPPRPPEPRTAGPSRPPVGYASNGIRPRYSHQAIRRGIQGVVVVEFEVTEQGTVRDVRIVSGAPELVEIVLRWVPTWRFNPALKAGKPIAWRKTETIRFRLED